MSHHSQSPLWNSRNHWWWFYGDKSHSNLDVYTVRALKCRWGLKAIFPPKSFWRWFGANLKPSSCILSTYSKLALELQHFLPGLWQWNTVQWDAQGRDYQNKSPTLCVVSTFVLWHKNQKKMISCFCQTSDFWYSCLALASHHSPICHSSAPKSSSIWTG